MRKLITFFLIFLAVHSYGQVYQNMPQYGYGPVKRFDIDSTLTIPTVCGIPTLKSNITRKSAIAYDTCNKRFYLYDSKLMAWDTIKGGTGSSIDTTSLSNRINNKIDSIKRNSDSVSYYKNGVKYFAYIDSSGAGSDTASVVKATVKNAENNTIYKGEVVFLYGATGNMASVKRAYNTSDTFSSKTFAIVKNDIPAGNTGTVITQGVVDKLNLGSFAEGDIVWLDSLPGQITKTKPYAPYHSVFIGVVQRANNGNGQLYVKVQNGYELGELHNVSVNGQVDNDVLYYQSSTKLWKAKSPYLLVDTTKLSARIDLRMKYTDSVSLSNRINSKLNISDTTSMLSPYVRSITLNNYLLKTDTSTLSNRINSKLNISDTASMLSNYVRSITLNGYTKYTDTSSMLSPYLRKVDTVNLSNRINLKVNISDTSSMLSKYLRKTDTSTLSSRIDLKVNISDTANMLSKYLRKTDTSTLSNRIDLKVNISDTTTMLSKYLRKTDTSTLSNRIGYSVTVGALATTLAASTTYYMGAAPFTATSTAAIRRVYIPVSGTIKSGSLYVRTTNTTSTENWTISIRLNNTSNSTLATVGTASADKVFSSSSLSISVVAGDYIELVTTTPAWTSVPGSTYIYGTIFIQP